MFEPPHSNDLERFRKSLEELVSKSSTASELLLAFKNELGYGEPEMSSLPQEQHDLFLDTIVNFSKIKAAQKAA